MGLFHPTVQGIIDGRIAGLKNSVNIVNYVISESKNKKLLPLDPYTQPGVEYFIGFGTGYLEGQQIRESIKNNSGTLSFENAINCFNWLLEKQKVCKQNVDKQFLFNIEKWQIKFLPTEITEAAHLYIKDKKIQRAIHVISNYYKSGYILFYLKKFDEIAIELKTIRSRKKRNTHYNIMSDLEKL